MNNILICTPTSPFSTKQIPILEENPVVVGLFWPKTYICVVLGWCNTIPTTVLVHSCVDVTAQNARTGWVEIVRKFYRGELFLKNQRTIQFDFYAGK